MNVYCPIGDTMVGNRNSGSYRDLLSKTEDNKLVYLSINMNGLHYEGWKVKNDMIRDFILKSKAEIIGFQEINLNWGKVPFRY